MYLEVSLETKRNIYKPQLLLRVTVNETKDFLCIFIKHDIVTRKGEIISDNSCENLI